MVREKKGCPETVLVPPATRVYEAHAEVTVFSAVELLLYLRGPDEAQAAALVTGFQRRCPVYGSLAVASGSIQVRHTNEPISSDP